jgi:hypothetical protein
LLELEVAPNPFAAERIADVDHRRGGSPTRL